MRPFYRRRLEGLAVTNPQTDGLWKREGIWAGYSYWRRPANDMYLYRQPVGGIWVISPTLGATQPPFFINSTKVESTYYPSGGFTGNAIMQFREPW